MYVRLDRRRQAVITVILMHRHHHIVIIPAVRHESTVSHLSLSLSSKQEGEPISLLSLSLCSRKLVDR